MTKQKKATFSMDQESLSQLEKLSKATGFNKSLILKVLIKTADENSAIKKLIEVNDNGEE